MGAPVVDITISRGRTFEFAYRYADDERVYRPITGMPSKAPCRLTVPGHGLPDGWPIRVSCVKAPVELNSDEHGGCGWYFPLVVDQNTIELNTVNATCWRPFSGDGVLEYQKPVDLTGYTARMQIRTSANGVILLTLSSSMLDTRDGVIQIEAESGTLVAKLDADVTAQLAWRTAVYDLEITTPTGEVYPVTGISQVTVEPEVTR